jgi:glycosyltransferase involved in cell wall biosynthesis
MSDTLPYDSILVVIPAYNEADRILQVVKRVREQGFTNVLVVDDGSPDQTAAVAASAGARIISHPINRGPGAATETGLCYARQHQFTYVATMDGDGQHIASDLHTLLAPVVSREADLVIGNRFLKGTNYIPRHRVFYNGIANLFTAVFARKWVSDTQSGMKAFGPKALHQLRIHMDGYEFCSEIIIKSARTGLRIQEVPITVRYSRASLQKGQGLLTGIKTLGNLFHHLLTRY